MMANKVFVERRNQQILTHGVFVKLGFVNAYVIRFDKPKRPKEYIEILNQLRLRKIISFPATEGLEIAGYFEDKSQLNLINSFGKTSIGVATKGKESHLYYDQNRNLGLIGSIPIVAAYRGIVNSLSNKYAWKMISTENKISEQGDKNSNLIKVPIGTIFENSQKYKERNDIPEQIFTPIRRLGDFATYDQVVVQKNMCFVKIDANNFSKGLLQTSPNSITGYLMKHISFFNSIEDMLRGYITDNVSERTTDSIEFYMDSNYSKKLEGLVKEIQSIENDINFKTIIIPIDKGTVLTRLDGRVIHSSNPVSRQRVFELETEAKKKQSMIVQSKRDLRKNFIFQ